MDPAMDPVAGGSSGAPGASSAAPAIRASDRERDAATGRLQDAFAEGRLDDAEFDARMRSALSARTQADLDGLLADLPARPGRHPGGRGGEQCKKGPGAAEHRVQELGPPVGPVAGPGPAHLGRVQGQRVAGLAGGRADRAGHHLAGGGLQVADHDPGAPRGPGRGGGFGADTDTDPAAVVPADAPVLHVRGYTYKGTVEVRSRPPED